MLSSTTGAGFNKAPGRASGDGKIERAALKTEFTLPVAFYRYSEMPQFLSNVIIHVIFNTKDREPWLYHDVRSGLHAYIATICRQESRRHLVVGGSSAPYSITSYTPPRPHPSPAERPIHLDMTRQGTVISCASTASISANGMFGTESRFQRLSPWRPGTRALPKAAITQRLWR